jgi:hypothetical protein
VYKKSKLFFFLCILVLIVFYYFKWDIYSSLAVSIFFFYLYNLLIISSKLIAFKEWTLVLYALNYLLAPALILHIDQNKVNYKIKLNAEQYYTLILPGFLMFNLGINFFKTRLFYTDFDLVKIYAILNEKILKQLLYLGVFLKVLLFYVSGDLNFFIYALSLIRFVGAFALFAIDSKKYFHWVVFVLLLEVLQAFVVGMYHDMTMWLVFFGIYYVYLKKSSLRWKLSFALISVVSILFIQSLKQVYRAATWSGDREASLSTALDIAESNTSIESLTGDDNLISTITRSNQAWIFASTVDHMDRYQDFQGLTNVKLYTEAALLPRFLAPDKIKSGDRIIFNKFSGHEISETTSMGLGIFADGYIAYGAWGVAIFGFALGLLFSITFKVVENWTKISPFFMLFIFPILNYAVRPDCETQTTINHLVKSMFIYWLLVMVYRRYFSQKLMVLKKQGMLR